MAAKQDIVIGAAAGYDWADVEMWARSLITSGFRGAGVVIVYDRDSRSDRVVQNLESLGLHAVRMRLRGSVYNQRFEDIASVLRSFVSSLRYAVVTDIHDVYFQADPIAWLEPELKRPFLAVSEGVRYGDEAWNRDNLRRAFPPHAGRLMPKVIRNVGVLAGQSDMVADLCLAISLMAKSAGIMRADQSGYNMLLDMEPYRSTVQLVASEDGFACQAGTLAAPGKVERLRADLVEPEPVFDAGDVRTSSGKLYTLVHQYDRVPQWDRALREKALSTPISELRERARDQFVGFRSHPEQRPGRPVLARAIEGGDEAAVEVVKRLAVPKGRSSMKLYSARSESSAVADDSPPPRVSIVCPTYRRPEFLRQAVRHYRNQTFGGGMEMIIVDDSPDPVDFLDEEMCRTFRIRYHHMPNKRMTIGDKVNLMTKMARGEIIMDFDDDDYYTPDYVERMVESLGDADFVTLSRWFAYDPANNVFCYWATDSLAPLHFVMSPSEGFHSISTKDWHPDSAQLHVWGYGFSFAWRKSVHAEVEVRGTPPKGLEWDYDFSRRLQQAGFKTVCFPDTEGLVLHILHPRSTVRMFPQYVLPDFLLSKFFPLYTASED